MGLFGLLNYEDYLVDLVIKSDRAHNGLIIFILCILTGIIRFHLSILICYFFHKDNSFDLIFPVIVTVLLSLSSNTLFQYIETHRPTCEDLVDYFIKNYTLQNFVRWKRMFLLCACCYVLLVTVLITIDNYFVILTTIQTAVSFIICDLLENNMPRILYNKIKNWLYQPQVVIYPRVNESAAKFNSVNDSDSVQPLPTYTQDHPIIENYVKEDHRESDYNKEYIEITPKNPYNYVNEYLNSADHKRDFLSVSTVNCNHKRDAFITENNHKRDAFATENNHKRDALTTENSHNHDHKKDAFIPNISENHYDYDDDYVNDSSSSDDHFNSPERNIDYNKEYFTIDDLNISNDRKYKSLDSDFVIVPEKIEPKTSDLSDLPNLLNVAKRVSDDMLSKCNELTSNITNIINQPFDEFLSKRNSLISDKSDKCDKSETCLSKRKSLIGNEILRNSSTGNTAQDSLSRRNSLTTGLPEKSVVKRNNDKPIARRSSLTSSSEESSSSTYMLEQYKSLFKSSDTHEKSSAVQELLESFDDSFHTRPVMSTSCAIPTKPRTPPRINYSPNSRYSPSSGYSPNSGYY